MILLSIETLGCEQLTRSFYRQKRKLRNLPEKIFRVSRELSLKPTTMGTRAAR